MADGDLPCTIQNAAGAVLFSGELSAAPTCWYERAVAFVRGGGEITTRALQLQFGIAYRLAAALIGRLEREGVVTLADIAGHRELAVPVPGRRPRRRVERQATVQDLLERRLAEIGGMSADQARRAAFDIARDLAMPVAETLSAAWRGLVDHALFDTPLERVSPGAEQVSTELYGCILDYAAAVLIGHAAALEMAHDFAAREAAK